MSIKTVGELAVLLDRMNRKTPITNEIDYVTDIMRDLVKIKQNIFIDDNLVKTV